MGTKEIKDNRRDGPEMSGLFIEDLIFVAFYQETIDSYQ